MLKKKINLKIFILDSFRLFKRENKFQELNIININILNKTFLCLVVFVAFNIIIIIVIVSFYLLLKGILKLLL